MYMKKVALMFSTGLDSILAYFALQRAGFEVIPVHFKTSFFGKENLEYFEDLINKKILVYDITPEFLKVLKSPKFGYGKNLNPCLDCKILMFKKLKELFPPNKFILASGEVLGQRPFSQHKDAFSIIEKEANLKNLIFRPLSAKLLCKTEYEKQGYIKKEDFFDIRGRGRKKQEELIKLFNLDKTKLPQPAGGCLLTDPNFSQKVKLYLDNNLLNLHTCKLLKVGKHFKHNNLICILARNWEENQALRKLKSEKDILIVPNFKGGCLLVVNGKEYNLSKDTLKDLALYIVQKTRHAPKDWKENFDKYFQIL